MNNNCLPVELRNCPHCQEKDSLAYYHEAGRKIDLYYCRKCFGAKVRQVLDNKVKGTSLAPSDVVKIIHNETEKLNGIERTYAIYHCTQYMIDRYTAPNFLSLLGSMQ